jgi:hypothetical protein
MMAPRLPYRVTEQLRQMKHTIPNLELKAARLAAFATFAGSSIRI